MFAVRLATAPATSVSVTVARTAGDTDVTVTAGSALTFTSGNYATPQYVTLAAGTDADASNDTATIRVSSSGLANTDVGRTKGFRQGR